MKIRFSPLISQASGSAGPVTASRWKGIPYMRERITPANPNLPLQLDQRARMRKVVAWYHDLESQVTDFLDLLAAGEAFSGFNAFTKRNVRDIYNRDIGIPPAEPGIEVPRIMPLNTPTNPIGSLVTAQAAGAKSISATFAQGDATTGDMLYVLAGMVPEDGDLPDNLVMITKDTILVSAGSTTLDMPDQNQMYFVAALVEHTEDHSFSVALVDWAESGPS
jgi:hypothetical protein